MVLVFGIGLTQAKANLRIHTSCLELEARILEMEGLLVDRIVFAGHVHFRSGTGLSFRRLEMSEWKLVQHGLHTICWSLSLKLEATRMILLPTASFRSTRILWSVIRGYKVAGLFSTLSSLLLCRSFVYLRLLHHYGLFIFELAFFALIRVNLRNGRVEAQCILALFLHTRSIAWCINCAWLTTLRALMAHVEGVTLLLQITIS